MSSSASMVSAGIGSGIAEQATTAAYNKNESKKGRDFQEAVMKNRIGWMVKDMKRAGINPLVAFNSGGVGGAGSVQPSVARMSGGTSAGSAKAIPEAFQKSESGKREGTQADINRKMPEVMDAQVEQLRTQSHKNRDQGALFFTQREESMRRADYYKALENSENWSARLKELEVPGARNRATVQQTPYIGTGSEFLKTIGDAIAPFMGRPGRARGGRR